MTPRTAHSAPCAASPPYSQPYSQLDEVDAHLPDDVTEQVAKLAYLLQAELVEWQAPRSLVAQAVAKAATRGWRLDSWRRARRTPDSSESASLRRGCSRRGSTLPSTAPALTRSGPSSSANIKCLRTRAGAFSGSGA